MASETTGLGYVALAPTRNPFNYDKFEQTNRDVVTPWLTLQEIADQLNLFTDESQDSYLLSLELAVRMAVEDYLGLPIVNTSYRVYYGVSALYGSPISLDLPEVSQSGVTINAVRYFNDAATPVLTTVASSTYFFDPTGSKVICSTLPSDINPQMTSPVIVDYTLTGSILATYPAIKQAGLLLYTHLYNNRSNTTELNLKTLPYGVDQLLRPYKPLVM